MHLRNTNLEALRADEFDVLVVGAGINGAVSAAALAAQGIKVGLIDKRDFAGFTSQESSNLAWGGIKYLESLEFGLVRRLCQSRNALITHYPSTVKEIRFLTSLSKGFRYPGWIMYLATLLYWVMGNCFTRAPRLLSPERSLPRPSWSWSRLNTFVANWSTLPGTRWSQSLRTFIAAAPRLKWCYGVTRYWLQPA